MISKKNSWYQKIILSIKKFILWFQKIWKFWYHKFEFLISKMIFWYHKIDFLILKIKVDFLITKYGILDIKKSFFLYKKSNSWYPTIFFWYKKSFIFYDIRKAIFWYQKIRPTQNYLFYYQLNECSLCYNFCYSLEIVFQVCRCLLRKINITNFKPHFEFNSLWQVRPHIQRLALLSLRFAVNIETILKEMMASHNIKELYDRFTVSAFNKTRIIKNTWLNSCIK